MTHAERNRRLQERYAKTKPERKLVGLRRVTAQACGVGFVPVMLPTAKESDVAQGMSSTAVAEIRRDIWRRPVYEYSPNECPLGRKVVEL